MKKVLIADDSSTILMLERMFLSRANYAVVSAVDGEDVVAKALSERPDLILLDVFMPKMDGLEACAKLRSLEATRDTPIILVSTRSEREHVDAARSSGASDYVTKPLVSTDLIARIHRLIGR